MSPESVFLLILAYPFLLSPVLAGIGSRLGARTGWVALTAPALAFAGLLWLGGQADLHAGTRFDWPWVPSLGVNLSFVLDGLSLFFALVVSGVGILVFLYATHYLDDHTEHHGRFYAYLTLFVGAMLGTVLSNNLLLLFVFWELTGISSFLLIGFLHGEESSRTGARQALLVTGFTGLLLLAGVLMVAHVAGTADFLALRETGLPFAEHGFWLGIALVLLALGAFGKSAQFPFHFWLPNAMAAPTPVSAYLHSATMVKLGIFLLARLFPLFAGQEGWADLLVPVGFGTMLLAAVFALLSHDLKAILAWSTVSALGFLVGYYGQGSAAGVPYDRLHIVNHVLYKGCLFMTVGVVAHATGIRDVRELGGLFRRMPLTGGVALVACAAMAGLPGTVGFLSKELALKEAFAAWGRSPADDFAAVSLVLASALKVAFSLRLFHGIFLGREPDGVGRHFHPPSIALQLPPALLAVATLVFGLFPAGLEHGLAALATRGLHTGMDHLALWHGFTRELAASAGIVAAGVTVFLVLRGRVARLGIPNRARLDLGFEAGMRGLDQLARTVTRALRTDRPVDHLVIVVGFTVLAVGGTLMEGLFGPDGGGLARLFRGLPAPQSLPVFVSLLITVSVVGVVVLRRWTTRLICLSVAGFLVCFYFVLYQAPDLALTQILVEVITLFLVLILLGRFPAAAEAGEAQSRGSRPARALHLAIALGVGVTMSLFLLLVTANPASDRLGDLLVSASVPLAKGTNAVNTTLIDFRGFDTMGEITVLVVATLGCLGLLMRYKRSEEEFRAGPMDAPGFGSFKDGEDDRAGT